MIQPTPRRFDRPVRFLRARLSPEGYLGLHLTIGLLVIVTAGWWFGDIAEDMSRNAATRALDDNIKSWFLVHATPLLTMISRVVTFFGSVAFLSSAFLLVGIVLAIRRAPVARAFIRQARLRCEQLIAVARIARDIVSQPVRRLEIFRCSFVVEFDFGHDQSLVLFVINIDLDYAIAERDFVARFHQPFALCRWPECIELYYR
jgi:hypothetical protein